MSRRTRETVKALHLEYLVTRQTSTGNGSLYVPQVHEGAPDDDRPPAHFTGGELGLSSSNMGPSVFATSRNLVDRNAGRAKARVAAEAHAAKLRAEALSDKPAPRRSRKAKSPRALMRDFELMRQLRKGPRRSRRRETGADRAARMHAMMREGYRQQQGG